MKLLEDRIVSEGVVKAGDILKVDMFLNHQMDISLLKAMGDEWKRLYDGEGVNKILTIEASGIGIAALAGLSFNVPVVFAKKAQTSNIDGDVYSARVYSYTHNREYLIRVSKQFLHPEDRILIIDDFLANGKALLGLIDICKQAGAYVVGCGIAIEKAYQGGGKLIRENGYRVESLAKIEKMSEEGIIFG